MLNQLLSAIFDQIKIPSRTLMLMSVLCVIMIVALTVLMVLPRQNNWNPQTLEQARLNGNELILALAQYKRDFDQYPVTLDLLVNEGYMKQLPENPLTGEFKYWVSEATGQAIYTLRYEAHPGFSGDRATLTYSSAQREWLLIATDDLTLSNPSTQPASTP